MADTISLFATAASPVIQAGLIAAAGAGMAWQGALDSRGCSVVAALCFYVFTPALTFSTLAAAISFTSIRHLWPLLVNMTVSSLLGLAIGHGTSIILRTPLEYRKLVIVAIAFGNVGNLPLVFVGALCGDTRAVFQKSLGTECVPLGIAYTAFDICVATLFQFTLALYLLKPPSSMNNLKISSNNYSNGGGSGGGNDNFLQSDPDYQVVVEQDEGEAYNLHGGSGSSGRLHKDPTLSDLLQAPQGNNDSPNSYRRRAAGSGGFEIELASEENSILERMKDWFHSIDWKSAFPVPTQAAFGGVIIGCIPPLKHLFYGIEEPPLRPVAEALNLLGQGLIPGAIPLLGAVLYRGPGKSQLPARVTVGVVLVRLVLQPVLLTCLVVLALKLKFYVAPDPMFLLTLLLANATPTAINMQTLTVLYKFGAEEMSQMLFFEYICSLVTLPGFVWLFLKIIHRYVGGVEEQMGIEGIVP
jgi:auxin efflux carrier family protein